jgi:2-O-methyltransferase
MSILASPLYRRLARTFQRIFHRANWSGKHKSPAMIGPPVSPGELDRLYLKQLLGADAALILEIGANDGTHTSRFLTDFPSATIYAFEPDPRASAKFKARVHEPRAHLFECAIGAKDGEAKFHVSSGLPDGMPMNEQKDYPLGWDQSGSLRAPKRHTTVWPWVKFETKIKVAVKRLDTWANEYGIKTVDLIWADVQGAEGDLIAGGKNTLARTRFLFTEYSNDGLYKGQPTLARLVKLLPNFSIVRRYPGDVLFKNDAFNS